MSIDVHLERFEGPLSLLLYLIKREEIDIYNIPIHEITKQYMKELEIIPQCDLEVAGDFIAMAATLLQIKSRMLLPIESPEDEEELEDPRKSLVQQLLVYQAYKDVAHSLDQLPLLGRDLWTRGVRGMLPQTDQKILVDENSLFILIAAYKRAFNLYKKRNHKVTVEEITLASCILELKEKLILGERKTFKQLIDRTKNTKPQVVIVLLSVLELSRMGFLSLFQADATCEIYIETKAPIQKNIMSFIHQNYEYTI